MKVGDIMTKPAIHISPNETLDVAARTLQKYNIGALPVCGSDGKLCGMVTDRDLVVRGIASGKTPNQTFVREVMSGQVTSVQPDMEAGVAAHLMGRLQIRRLPVVEQGKLSGMLSLGDLSKREESVMDAADALTDISGNISNRDNW